MAKAKKTPLTGFSLLPHKARRGPKTLDQMSLINRRDGLVQIFERHWGRIGWELQHCRVPEDIRLAFLFLHGKLFNEVIDVLCRPSTKVATKEKLRELRRRIGRLVPHARNEFEANQRAQERLFQARAAHSNVGEKHDPTIKTELESREATAKTERDYDQVLRGLQQEFDNELRESEAAHARQELLRIIMSRRYELTPVNLANAAAGLPFMSCRQSVKRCRETDPIVRDGECFRAFKAIRYLLSTVLAHDDASLVKHFAVEIPHLSTRHSEAKRDLAKHWYFLSLAIQQAATTTQDPKRLSFQITQLYLDGIEHQSAADVLLSEKKQLPI